jgi:hypothetical protein
MNSRVYALAGSFIQDDISKALDNVKLAGQICRRVECSGNFELYQFGFAKASKNKKQVKDMDPVPVCMVSCDSCNMVCAINLMDLRKNWGDIRWILP